MTRQRFKHTGRATVVVSMAIGLLGYLVLPAKATPTQESPPPEEIARVEAIDAQEASADASSDPAPTCVTHIEHDPWWRPPYVDVKNECSYTVRVKVIIAWGPDSGCQRLERGQTFRHGYGEISRFDGLVRC